MLFQGEGSDIGFYTCKIVSVHDNLGLELELELELEFEFEFEFSEVHILHV